ncbi:MAG: phosphoglucosamine mutase [Solirubrobacterales bacterium]|nr:phosphoglucosamine mutase [Solirubrobacterales bacterium]OJU93500.1 MAG: phosphoglucosamine mutase [Solirubrobacterales bacterium 67-14]
MSTPTRTLFGTDGVRGRVGDKLTTELALSIGRAGTESLRRAKAIERPRVLIIRDTRESGPMLEAALAAGIAESGGEVYLGGVLPTPAAALISGHHGFDLAAVVSASHNPFYDNGIKLFGGDGGKLDDETEAGVEALIHEPPAPASEPGRIVELSGAEQDYLRALESHFRLDLSGLKVTLDCANGATYRVAGEIFRRLGAEVELLATEPDGRNINDGCGSTDLGLLAASVAGSDSRLGFAFDGDGDRVLTVDGAGNPFDGDEMIALVAARRAAAGTLGGGVAVTVMSNYGFHQAMKEAGVEVEVTSVGDRYVLEGLRKRDWVLGGEQSGHIISTDYAPTGDGIAAALMLLQVLDGEDLAEARVMEKLPQVLVNVEVADREQIAGADSVWTEVDRLNSELEGQGRVLLRPSGTEPLVRVMAEAPRQEQAQEICDSLAELVRRELG